MAKYGILVNFHFCVCVKDHAKWIGGFIELFVASNYLFRQKQENDCTLLRWITLGTCKVLHNLSMKGSCLFVTFLSHSYTIGKPLMNKGAPS